MIVIDHENANILTAKTLYLVGSTSPTAIRGETYQPKIEISDMWRSREIVELQVCGLAGSQENIRPRPEAEACAGLALNHLKSRVVRLGTRLDDLLRRFWKIFYEVA
jgi:hypothetical protein